jgi:hypothetical protein
VLKFVLLAMMIAVFRLRRKRRPRWHAPRALSIRIHAYGIGRRSHGRCRGPMHFSYRYNTTFVLATPMTADQQWDGIWHADRWK